MAAVSGRQLEVVLLSGNCNLKGLLSGVTLVKMEDLGLFCGRIGWLFDWISWWDSSG